MNTMRKLGTGGLVLAIMLAVSCAGNPGWTNYREGMFQGYKLLSTSQYQPAIQQFTRASEGDPTKAIPLALAGQAAYQIGDYAQASRYLTQALSLVNGPDAGYVIIKGYQSLIAFRDNKRQEGMAALGEYLKVYYHLNYESTYTNVKQMYDSGNVVLPELEQYINQQMTRYEGQLMQWGWMAQ